VRHIWSRSGGEITPTDNVSIDPEIPQGVAAERKKINKLIGNAKSALQIESNELWQLAGHCCGGCTIKTP